MRWKHVRRAAGGMAVGAALAVLAAPADANETDQYTMPVNRPLADVGDFLDATHTRVVERAVAILNQEVEQALKDPDPIQRKNTLAWIRRPEHLAYVVHDGFNDALTEIMDIESALRSDWAKKAYPGQHAIYGPSDWIYSHSHFWIDPRRYTLVFHSSTLKAYGVCFGTDKLSHFHHMGSFYYDAYLQAVSTGMSQEDAMKWAVNLYVNGNPLAENGFLGFLSTGVFSNADQAANYMGMKFYINVSEPVMLKGVRHEPMIIRRGEFFRANRQIRPESGWFGAFISDHWNEALNPCWYEPTVRWSLEGKVRDRAEVIHDFYTRCDGRPDEPAYYANLAEELSTYYGEEYGHSEKGRHLLTLDQVCWPTEDKKK